MHLAAAGFHFVDFFHPLRYWGYQFWSGIGSDLSEITLVGILLGFLKHKNCEKRGCWRLGHVHPEHGRPVCRRHYHSEVAPPAPVQSVSKTSAPAPR